MAPPYVLHNIISIRNNMHWCERSSANFVEKIKETLVLRQKDYFLSQFNGIVYELLEHFTNKLGELWILK